MLEINDLQVAYGRDSLVVDGFGLSMQPGEIVSIVGESGSGKTTVIRAVLGALPENGKILKGKIFFHGEDISSYGKETWRKIRGRKMSMIFQDSGGTLDPIRKIGTQFIEYIAEHSQAGKREAWEQACDMLGRMRLPNPESIMKSYPFQLSGGMRQRVGIAMAMTFQPELLLADEPTSALDVTTQAQIVRQMIELREQYHTGIIIVTHNLGVAAYMADQLIVMKEGKVVDAGDRERVLRHPSHPYTKKLLGAVPVMGGKRFA